jgi:EAL domain-containing protein (putative c-di-GMP-specific phosphodiesterase class I)
VPDGAFVSLNVSAEALASSEVIDLLGEAPAGRIVLELTEHAPVDDYPALGAALDRLRASGVRLAIDDTGSGWSSFRHVLALVPNVIKLDIALTRDIDRDPVRRALAASLVTFADEVGAVIVAEGVETEAEIATLRRLGVAYGQGYCLGRPAPLPVSAAVEQSDGPQSTLEVVLEGPGCEVLGLVAGR